MSRPQKPAPADPGRLDGLAPPHDLGAEEAVLCIAMTDPNAGAEDLVVTVRPEDFYSEAHRRIWTVVTELVGQGRMPDMIHVEGRLKTKGELVLLDGGRTLHALGHVSCTLTQASEYAKIVAAKAKQRAMLTVLHRCVALGYLGGQEPADYLAEVTTSVESAVKLDDADVKPMWVEDIVKGEFAILAASKTDTPIAKSGLAELDRMVAMRSGDMVVVAGRPGMGKTSFALQLAFATGNTLFVSMEMMNGQLGQRALSSKVKMGFAAAVLNANGSNEVSGRVAKAFASMKKEGVQIVDKPALTVAEIRAFARHTSKELERRGLGPLRAVVVDYLQLMRAPEVRSSKGNREEEISSISQGLKAMAKQLKIAVVALSQLNRSLESRADKRPNMSDLRESGAIEQDADKVLMIYRENYYLKRDTGPIEPVEILVAKQRQGATGVATVGWHGPTTTFTDLDDGMPDWRDS